VVSGIRQGKSSGGNGSRRRKGISARGAKIIMTCADQENNLADGGEVKVETIKKGGVSSLRPGLDHSRD